VVLHQNTLGPLGVNSLFLIHKQIHKPIRHINHLNKVMLASIVSLMQTGTQPLFLHKVRTHFNIYGNDKANELAKVGNRLSHRPPISDYKHTHSTPYYLYKDWWHSMTQTPYKGPIRNLQEYIDKCDRKYNLQTLANSFPNIRKWTIDKNIDKKISINFWDHPEVTDSQLTCLYNQYLGNARKQLFFGPILYPSITCPICNSLEIDTWPHILFNCKNSQIHVLRIKRHNKAVSEIIKLLVSSSHFRSLILMNAGIYDATPPNNTVPPWLLPCVCQTTHCHCDVRLKPDILCIHGVPYNHEPPQQPSPDVIIQYIEFTYCNNRFSPDKVASKQAKYDSLLNNIRARG
jgi:hypothetical protein